MRVIIFDYDDTLFPSSYIGEHDLYHTPIHSQEFVHHREKFQELETSAICTLTKAMAVGDLVVIVTNGKLDWIRYSMKMFYHRFFDFVRKNETPIVSAQDIFSSSNPHPVMWKVNCFRQLLGSLQSTNNIPTQLISIGDGSHEAVACEVSAREFNIPFRNVNFLETPSPKQLTQQLYLLGQEFSDIVSFQNSVEINTFNSAVVCGGFIEFHSTMQKMTNGQTCPEISRVAAH
jgi:hypothetical protein